MFVVLDPLFALLVVAAAWLFVRGVSRLQRTAGCAGVALGTLLLSCFGGPLTALLAGAAAAVVGAGLARPASRRQLLTPVGIAGAVAAGAYATLTLLDYLGSALGN